uniref:Ig-like domain-containing protein n=1 Tax=Callorhinchus milii TaxID=7868 RepID=A0A4W3H728_CALMI
MNSLFDPLDVLLSLYDIDCILIPDPLQKPNISLQPDSREFVRKESAELSCSGNYPGSNFSLYRNGEFITSQTTEANISTATFKLLEIREGNYSCIYVINIDGRQFTSSESDRVEISVRGKSSVKLHTITCFFLLTIYSSSFEGNLGYFHWNSGKITFYSTLKSGGDET